MMTYTESREQYSNLDGPLAMLVRGWRSDAKELQRGGLLLAAVEHEAAVNEVDCRNGKPSDIAAAEAAVRHCDEQRLPYEEQRKSPSAWTLLTASVTPATTLEEMTDRVIDQRADEIDLPYDDGGSARTLCHKVQRVTKIIMDVRDKNGSRFLDPMDEVSFSKQVATSPIR